MKCTGRNCPMQNGTVDPAHCLADECPYITKPMTNADRIRAMTDEKLANFLFPFGSCPIVADGLPFNESADCSDDCEKCWLDWLKKEVEE